MYIKSKIPVGKKYDTISNKPILYTLLLVGKRTSLINKVILYRKINTYCFNGAA